MVNAMGLNIFDNVTGQGVVSFEPWRVSGPEYQKDNSRWYCHMLIHGERVFEYGCPCGTCGILFRKIGSPADRVTDMESVTMLGALNTVPPNDILRRLGRVLEKSLYYPNVIQGRVRLVDPGSADDYFVTEVTRLFGRPGDKNRPESLETPYYRLGTDFELSKVGYRGLPYKALVTAVVVPLHEPAKLNRERVEYWKQKQQAGVQLTAFAVSVLDKQSPAVTPPDATYPYTEQLLLTNCLLDGHHRLQAAAETGLPIRILSMVAKYFSFGSEVDLAQVLQGYALGTHQ